MAIKRPRHSFSRLSTFVGCGRRYAAEALGPRMPASAAMAKGTQVHEALARMSLNVLNNGVSYLDLGVSDDALEGTKGPLLPVELADYLSRAAPVLNGYVPEGVEQWFELDIKGRTLCGKIDLVAIDKNGAKTVLDFKIIGATGFAKTANEARYSLQAQIYALVTGATRAGFVFLKPKGAPIVSIATFDETAIATTRRWLEAEIGAIERTWDAFDKPGKYKTNGGALAAVFGEESPWHLAARDNALCSLAWCPYWGQCIGKEQEGKRAPLA